MKPLQQFLAHCNIVFGAMFLVLLILNRYNPTMHLLNGAVFLWFLCLFCLCALLLGILTIILRRRAQRMSEALAHPPYRG